MGATVPPLSSIAMKCVVDESFDKLLKMTHNIRPDKIYHPAKNNFYETYVLSKIRLNNLENFIKNLHANTKNKLSEDWSATLSDVWDEIDHVNQITSWDPREHLSDYHGLDENEESCSCFSEASDAITREVIRLLLHQCTRNDSLWMRKSEEKESSGPPTKRRKIII